MDVRQRADDALEAVTDLRDGALADLRHELGRAGHPALGKIEALEKDIAGRLESELRKILGGKVQAAPADETAPAADEPAPAKADPAPAKAP